MVLLLTNLPEPKGTLMAFSHTWLRISGATAAGVLVLSTAATASATTPTPPISSPTVQFQHQVNTSGNCAADDTTNEPTAPTVTPNGSAAVVHAATTGTVTNNAVAGDVSTVSVSTATTYKLRASAANPTSITANLTGTGRVVNATGHSPSACPISSSSITSLLVPLTLSRGELVTINAHSLGGGYTVAQVASLPTAGRGNAGVIAGADAPGATGTTTAFLPAGTYEAIIGNALFVNTSGASTSSSGSSSVTITFTPGGSRTSGPSGNAGRFVRLGGARSCASHTLASHVTFTRKYARQIKTVTVLANGRQVKRVVRPAAGRSLTVKLPDTQNENVRFKVVLRNGKRLAEVASYLRCS